MDYRNYLQNAILENESKMLQLSLGQDKYDSSFETYVPTHELQHGRKFATPVYGEASRYLFPVDDDSVIQQELSDAIWSQHVLLSTEGLPTGDILELGAGAGTWAQATALTSPERQVIGLDTYFPNSSMDCPTNCIFEVDDYEAPWPREGTVAFAHLRHGYTSVRKPSQLAEYVFRGVCDGGGFQNEEMRIDKWISNSEVVGDWSRRFVKAARKLGLPLPSALDLDVALRDAGFRSIRMGSWRLDASRSTYQSALLLEYVKHVVRSSIKVLVEGERDSKVEQVRAELDNVVADLDGDCTLSVEMEIVSAEK